MINETHQVSDNYLVLSRFHDNDVKEDIVIPRDSKVLTGGYAHHYADDGQRRGSKLVLEYIVPDCPTQTVELVVMYDEGEEAFGERTWWFVWEWLIRTSNGDDVKEWNPIPTNARTLL